MYGKWNNVLAYIKSKPLHNLGDFGFLESKFRN